MQETTHLILERIPGPLTEKQERLLQLNLQSGKRLAAMIGNLLDFSRLEAGIVDYEMQLQDVRELVQSVVTELTPRAHEKALHIMVDFPEEALMTMCDPNRMIQVFTNLLDNAVRFSSKGGSVSLRMDEVGTPPTNAARPPYSPEGYILLSISDSGPGIEGLTKDRIFGSFPQVEQGKKTFGQSLGLGLAISRALIEAHQGTIWVEDNPNGGSVFSVLLPKASAQFETLDLAS